MKTRSYPEYEGADSASTQPHLPSCAQARIHHINCVGVGENRATRCRGVLELTGYRQPPRIFKVYKGSNLCCCFLLDSE